MDRRFDTVWPKIRRRAKLYGLLKRSDEKYVTEKAYDNPKFVEDVVRDMAAATESRRTDRRLRGGIGKLRIHP